MSDASESSSSVINSHNNVSSHETHSHPHSVQITTIRLNGDNFLRWSQSVRMYIRGRGKIGYLTGEKKEPKPEDPAYSTWDAENSMVMTWLVNSMTEDISGNYMCYSTAKELWDNVNQMYSDLGNQSQVYELTLKLGDIRQGNDNVTKYFNSLKRLWQDLDLFNDYEWKSIEDANYNKKTVEAHRIYKFLAGLNVEFDEVRGRIIGRSPLPPIGEVFAEVRREESRRSVMLGKSGSSGTVETSALLVSETAANKAEHHYKKSDEKPRAWCDFCNRPRHTRETCWKLHGKPANWKSSRPSRAIASANEAEISPFSKEQMNQLLKLLKSNSSSGFPGASVAQSGSDKISALSCSSNYTSWIIDSGASDHMTSVSSLFNTYSPCSGLEKIRIADGTLSSIAGKGLIKISENINLNSVLHVPKLACNLLSVSKLSKESNCRVIFFDSHCEFQDQISGKKIGSARMMDGLYYFDDGPYSNKKAQGMSSVSSSSVFEQIMIWHFRLGHPSFQYLRYLFPTLFKGLDCSTFHCEHCILSKSHRTSYLSKPYVSSKPFYLIHSDVWGPSKIPTTSGKKWFVTFIDDHTRLCWIYLMHEKSDVEKLFKDFYTMIETQFQTKISILHTDNGTEYFNKRLGTFLKEKGIYHQSTCVDTPQQNGIAERKNRHLLEVARAIMFSMNVPKYLWGEALLTAAYLINRMPTRVLKYQTPLMHFKHYFPLSRIYSDLPLKVFGCTVFVHISHHSRSKLDPRAEHCVFIGYASNKKGYRCYNPLTRKFFVSMDVSFLENKPYFQKNSLQGEKQGVEDNFWDLSCVPLPNTILKTTPLSSSSNSEENFPKLPNIDVSSTGGEMLQNNELQVYTRKGPHQKNKNPPIIPEPDQSSTPRTGIPEITGIPIPIPNISSDLDIPIALRKGSRECTKNPRYPMAKYLSYEKLSHHHRAFSSKISHLIVPRSVQEALNDPHWKLAVMEEMNALRRSGTWEIVDLPKEKKTVGCKWVFTVKCRADGSIERYKARLVAKGFTQTYGIDYQETFAPVAKINSVRVLLSLAVNFNWPLHQLDVKNAFLNGDLEEEVFMSLPPGFEERLGPDKVCKLRKSLYGLKQSPRAWFERFGNVVKTCGYSQSQADHTMFYKHSKEGKIAILIVYVDDIVLTGDDTEELEKLKRKLAAAFEIKDLGPLKYFLGMEFARSKEGIFVNQRKYVLDLLGETGLLGCKPADTPIEPNLKLQTVKAEEVRNREQYQRLVGRLIYLSHTRPDIAFAVSMVSQFMHSPGQEHFDAVYRILRYLKGSPGKGLIFKKYGHLQVEAYTDADWAGSITDRRSTSGYCTFVGGNLVTWRSKKQNVVARSSAEAEFRAVAHGICEVIWIKRLLEDLKISNPLPMKLYCDNKATISIAHNPVFHDRTKHVEVDRHFIKEKLDTGLICMPFVTTTEQVADVLTKGLPKKQFDDLIGKLAMEDIFKPA
ncbi:hypothetical protein ACOSP7_010531 [Xanthoceras sorbifolium]